MKKLLGLLGILILLTGCSKPHSSVEVIEALLAEYEVDDYNCFIMDTNGGILKNDYNEKTNIGYKWIDSFALPMILEGEFEDGNINEDSLLCRYISVRSIHADLRLRELIRVPENRPDLFSQNSDDVLTYMRHLIRKQFQDVYTQFYNNKLGIIDNPADTKKLLMITQRLSSCFDELNMTQYLPIGDKIPDLYPTWYVENMHQLAGWYTFRINKHVVLWNSISDNKHAVLCIKFIDLQRTLAIVYPYNADFCPFDSNGNPDLLLSPLALTILKEELEPNASKIDYEGTKEEICQRLLKKMDSPYLSLYIKELQTRIRKAENTGRPEDEMKLKDVYNTLFANSLSLDYLSKCPLSAINYVSDRMSASRYFTLDKETPVTIFSSNQCRKYLSKNKNENDSIIVADKCWLENVETKKIVWEPTVSSYLSDQTIRVERCDTVLPSGNYLMRYESDGKHSFESWLSSPPIIDDYGIRIYKKEGE